MRIRPELLNRLLQPHHAKLAAHGASSGASDPLDPVKIAECLSADTDGAFTGLMDSLYLIHEVSGQHSTERIVDAARQLGSGFSFQPDDSPADMAARLLLHDHAIVLELHAESIVEARTSFKAFQAKSVFSECPQYGRTVRTEMCRELAEWFKSRYQGGFVSITPLPRAGEVWFVVQHGGAYQRHEVIRGVQPATTHYRAAVYDVVVLQPVLSEIRINCSSAPATDQYREVFGRHLFGDAEFFPGGRALTLEPLWRDGVGALACQDVPGIDWIRLREIQVYRGGEFAEITVHKATDVFAARGGAPLQHHGGVLSRATFEVKFSDAKRTRRVTVAPPNVTKYSRHDDSALIEAWLRKRGFTLSRGEPEREAH